MNKERIEAVQLLGGFQLRANDNSIFVQGKKTTALLGRILTEPAKRVNRGYVEALLWSQRSPEQAKASLRQCLSDLRRQLKPLENFELGSNRSEIWLNLESVSLDIDRFEEQLGSNDLESKFAAVDIYRGPLLNGLRISDPAFEEWMGIQRLKYQRNYIALLKDILNELNPNVHLKQIKRFAENLLEVDNCSEVAHSSLMECFIAEGDKAKAIQQFRICRDLLNKELSVKPSQQLVNFYEKISSSQEPSTPHVIRNPISTVYTNDLSVAVLPFAGIGGLTQEKLLDPDVAGDIRTGLSKFKWISVAPRFTTMGIDFKNSGFQKICNDINVRYVIDGSISYSKNCYILKIELLDGIESTIVWAESYSININEQQELDRTLSRIICQLDVRLRTREIKRIIQLKPDEFSAYDCVIRAVSNIQLMTPEAFRYADELFDRAIKLDPEFPAIYTWKVYWEIFCIGQGWATNPRQEIIKAFQIATEALIRDPEDSLALAMQGHFQSFVEHNFIYARELHKRAYELNPNCSMVLLLNSFTYSYCGKPDKALERLKDLEDMTHMEPQHQFFYYLAKSVAHTFARDYESGVLWGLNCISNSPSFANGYKPLICCLGHLGRKTQALPHIEVLLKLEPSFCIEEMKKNYPFENEDDRQHYINGIEKAGVEYYSRSQ